VHLRGAVEQAHVGSPFWDDSMTGTLPADEFLHMEISRLLMGGAWPSAFAGRNHQVRGRGRYPEGVCVKGDKPNVATGS
jgi:hypothetical protein